ncbi:unnamed protein product, partial [Iphiclides podalirius]
MPYDSEFGKYATEYDPIKIGSIDGTDTEPHDRAICRALISEYTPNKQVQGDPQLTIFVARLNPRTTQETIHSEFSKFEYIDGTEVIVEREAERRLIGWRPRRLGGGFGGRKESGQLRFGCREKPFRKPIIVTQKQDNEFPAKRSHNS